MVKEFAYISTQSFLIITELQVAPQSVAAQMTGFDTGAVITRLCADTTRSAGTLENRLP